jgi:hypothetical protein
MLGMTQKTLRASGDFTTGGISVTGSPFYQGVLKRLAALAVAVGTTGGAAAAEELGAIPLDVAENLVDARELDDWDDEDRARLLQLLARDARPALRVRVAERLGRMQRAVLDEHVEALLDRLALDADLRVRDAVLHALDHLVPRLTGLERSSLIGRWATSSHFEHRLLAARVLRNRFPMFWVDDVLEHLSQDPSVSVRAAARHAAEVRGIA